MVIEIDPVQLHASVKEGRTFIEGLKMVQKISQVRLGYSPQTRLLIRAVRRNNTKAAAKLIKLGANPNAKVENNNSLLHICTSATMGQILLLGGARINTRNNNLETPIHTSMRRGLNGLTAILIANNADLNLQDNKGFAPLHLAESVNINDMLLEYNADPDIQDNVGDTPLHLAIRMKGSPVVTSLINNGADRDIKNNVGNNAFAELALLIQRRMNETKKISKAVLDGPGYCSTGLEDFFPGELVEQFKTAKSNLEKTVNTALHEMSSYSSKLPAFELSKTSSATSTPGTGSLRVADTHKPKPAHRMKVTTI